MTEQAQAAFFQVHIRLTPDGRIETTAQGNLNPAFVYAQLGVIMRKIEQQMENPALPALASRGPEFKVRRVG